MSGKAVFLGASLVLIGAAVLAPSASAVGPEGGLDNRAWELVSPALAGGGQVQAPGGESALQAAADGDSLAFGSPASFAEGEGAPPTSQYIATRAPGGWTTANISPPLLSGAYETGAYQLFSADLSRSLLSNGWRCRDGSPPCAAENPPLAPGALPGHRNLYRREADEYSPLLTAANAPALALAPEKFELSLAGAIPDLDHAAISTCAALTADATEVPGPSGCDPAAQNLYRWSEGTLSAINLLPGETETAPGATLAAPAGAISLDGSRVYFSHEGDLYLRDGAVTKPVATEAAFQAASADGSLAFYLAAGHLHRYDTAAGTSTDLTPAGGAQGVLGASTDGTRLYYLTTAGLFLRQGSAPPVEVAATADPSNLPPATGTAHTSADGTRFAFLSSTPLTGHPHTGTTQTYLYTSTTDTLVCVSCNPKGTPPAGDSTLPGSRAAAEGPASYKPRALSVDGRRLFFDSADALVPQDTDGLPDAYQWEAQGAGTCTSPGGCLALISFGRAGSDAFLDASADGDDAFFLTGVSLAAADHGGQDVYDARAGGGFPEPSDQIVCEGDACQGIVLPPDDPAPGTAALGRPNPPPRYLGGSGKAKKKKAKRCKRAGRCKRSNRPHRGNSKRGQR